MRYRILREFDTRLWELERRVEHLYRHLGDGLPPLPEPWNDAPDEVIRLAREGKKIKAIIAYRQATGRDLATAKRVVELIPR